MIISHQHRFIFLKTRKTAGTSLEIALSQFCGPDDVISSLSADDEKIRKSLGYRGMQNIFAPVNSYILREWGRMILYRKRKLLGGQRSPASFVKRLAGDETWDAYFKFTLERNPFDRAISRYYWKTKKLTLLSDVNDYIQKNDRQQLSNWDKYTIDNKIVVDFVGHYENLHDDTAHIARTIGLPRFTIPHIKGHVRKDHRHYSQILNANTRTYIDAMCGNEIKAFQHYWTDRIK